MLFCIVKITEFGGKIAPLSVLLRNSALVLSVLQGIGRRLKMNTPTRVSPLPGEERVNAPKIQDSFSSLKRHER